MSLRVKASEVPAGGVRVFEIDGAPVAVFERGGRYFALGNRCPHSGGPLALGKATDDEAVCPWHGARFALESGCPTWGPTSEAVPVYTVRRSDDELEIECR